MAIPLKLTTTGTRQFTSADTAEVNSVVSRTGSNLSLGALTDTISFVAPINTAVLTDATTSNRDFGSATQGWSNIFTNRVGGGAALSAARALSDPTSGVPGAEMIGLPSADFPVLAPGADDVYAGFLAVEAFVAGITPSSKNWTWNVNGVINAVNYPVLGVGGSLIGGAIIDGTREVATSANITIAACVLHQGTAGESGNTEAEVYRMRAGVATRIATLTLAYNDPSFIGSNFGRVALTPAGALGILQNGDRLYMQLITLQGANPANLTVEVLAA